jgi:hypothetical protein
MLRGNTSSFSVIAWAGSPQQSPTVNSSSKFYILVVGLESYDSFLKDEIFFLGFFFFFLFECLAFCPDFVWCFRIIVLVRLFFTLSLSL